MEKIYKYKINFLKDQVISAPRGALFLYADIDCNDEPCVWAAVNTDEEEINYRVFVVPTGADFKEIFPDNYEMQRLGMLKRPPYIWHIFIGLERPMQTVEFDLDDLNSDVEIQL